MRLSTRAHPRMAFVSITLPMLIVTLFGVQPGIAWGGKAPASRQSEQVAALVGQAPQGSPPVPASSVAARATGGMARPTDAALDLELFNLINLDRATKGVAPLKWDWRIGQVAEDWPYNGCGATIYGRSLDMIQRNYFAHLILNCHHKYVWNMMNVYPIDWTMVAENIGWESGYADPAVAVNDAFMHSPPHRAAILNPHYTYVGVGSATSGANCWYGNKQCVKNVWMFTEVFAKLGSPPPPSPTPAAMAMPAATPTPTPTHGSAQNVVGAG